MLQTLFEAFRRLVPGGGTPVAERREVVRIECKVPAVCISPSGEKMKAVVVDMGMQGLRLETEKKLTRNKTVKIFRPDGGPVECMVVWTRAKRFSDKFQAGLHFVDSSENLRASWVKGTLQTLGFAPGRIKEKRKHIRVPSEQRAVLISRAGDELTDGQLMNIGIGGALVEATVEVPTGTKVVLRVDPVATLSDLEMACEVRSVNFHQRSQKYQHGLRFNDQNNELVRKYLSVLMRSV